mmetsp:Transcript_50479/g.96435  ORF Transcript_50479/g.96435 Transcript_50479/m.96435 type:complete len:144 (-) Transcript_50479:265-696(-)
MTDDPSSCIGLNEVALGIAVPKYWCEVMACVAGRRVAQELLTSAAMPKAREALQLGLVDDVVPSSDLMAAAEKRMVKMLKVPSNGYAVTKAALRNDLAIAWDAYMPAEIETVYAILSSKECVNALGRVKARLSSGSTSQKAKL